MQQKDILFFWSLYNPSMQMSPAEYVVHVFGGVRATAKALGDWPSTVSRWRKNRADGGCDGNVPAGAQRRIMAVAKKKKLDITPSDLMYGRSVRLKK